MPQRLSLHAAAQNGHVAAIKALLEAHADVDAALLDGRRALHSAAMQGHVDAIKALLEAHADVDAATNDGSCSARSTHAASTTTTS